MYNIININNIFSLGFRCNTDEFLSEFLKIRRYSSPFSYMIIDIKTALNFIDNNFLNYTNENFILPGKDTYKFNKDNWSCKNIHKYSILTDDYVDILDTEKVCIWNHHNLYDKNIVNSLNRRSLHLLECLDKKSDTTLLFYIEKIQTYKEKVCRQDEAEGVCYFDKSILDNYNCNFLILIPLLNFNSDPILFYDDSRIRIIYFNSTYEGIATDIRYNIEEWNKLQILINKLYNFNIENRNDD